MEIEEYLQSWDEDLVCIGYRLLSDSDLPIDEKLNMMVRNAIYPMPDSDDATIINWKKLTSKGLSIISPYEWKSNNHPQL